LIHVEPGGVIRAHQRELAGAADGRDQLRAPAEIRAGLVLQRDLGELGRGQLRRHQRGLQAVGHRALRDDGRDRRLLGGDRERVAAAEGGAEETHLRDPLQPAGVGEPAAPVLELAVDVQQLPRLTAAGAEVAVVEDERGEAGGREALGVRRQALVAHRGQAVAEHDRARRSFRVQEPRGDLAGEGDVLP
jgi:hypothetical protein